MIKGSVKVRYGDFITREANYETQKSEVFLFATEALDNYPTVFEITVLINDRKYQWTRTDNNWYLEINDSGFKLPDNLKFLLHMQTITSVQF